MTRKSRLTFAAAAAGALTACADVDAMLHNPRHCSIIGPDTCERASDPIWGKLCAACDDPYDWGIEYAWMEQTFDEGQSARAIDASTVTQMSIPTSDGLGSLDAYLVPSHGEDPDLAGITIVYSHGNFASIEHYLPRVRYLHELGVSVFVWDYRGYGKSEPNTAPNGEQFVADARLALNEALNLTGGVAVVRQQVVEAADRELERDVRVHRSRPEEPLGCRALEVAEHLGLGRALEGNREPQRLRAPHRLAALQPIVRRHGHAGRRRGARIGRHHGLRAHPCVGGGRRGLAPQRAAAQRVRPGEAHRARRDERRRNDPRPRPLRPARHELRPRRRHALTQHLQRDCLRGARVREHLALDRTQHAHAALARRPPAR